MCLTLYRVHCRGGRRPECQEACIIPIDFKAAFERVTNRGIFKLCNVGICGYVESVLTQFLSNRSKYIVVNGCRSKLVNLVSVVPIQSVLGHGCSSGTP